MHFTQPANPPGLSDILYAEFLESSNNKLLTVGSDGVLRQFHPSHDDDPPKEIFQVAGSAFQTLSFVKTV